MSPRNDGSSTSSTVSVGCERGLANCPAIRPTFTTGTPEEYVRITAIWRITLSLSRIESAEKASKLSAQSPACNRNAPPSPTRASCSWRLLASPAKTRGGWVASVFCTRSSDAGSGHSGCWAAGLSCQLDGLHVDSLTMDKGARRGRLCATWFPGQGSGQAAVTRSAASSRTVFTARFTSRRAASAVTPSSSPTSR